MFPTWFRFVCAAVVLVPMAVVQLSGAHPRWRLVERGITLLFFVAAGAGALSGLAILIRSSMSLATIVVVAARAINVLGG